MLENIQRFGARIMRGYNEDSSSWLSKSLRLQLLFTILVLESLLKFHFPIENSASSSKVKFPSNSPSFVYVGPSHSHPSTMGNMDDKSNIKWVISKTIIFLNVIKNKTKKIKKNAQNSMRFFRWANVFCESKWWMECMELNWDGRINRPLSLLNGYNQKHNRFVQQNQSKTLLKSMIGTRKPYQIKN